MKKQRLRLDQALCQKMPEYSRQQIQQWIVQGNARVNNKVVTKSGAQVAPDDHIELDVQESQYVSRAGLKLQEALDHFDIDVKGTVALDAGISTGGFSDCLLQRGIAKIYGVDVGHGQTHERIMNDSRVEMLEKTNLRNLETLGELVDLATLDLSFISVLKVMNAAVKLIKPGGKLVVLIKPQFEVEKHEVGKGGIIKDPVLHERVKKQVIEGIEAQGFQCHGVIDSPIVGGDGNREFLACFTKT